MKMSDGEVVEQFVKMMPPHVRALMAEPMRPLLAALIQRERARCVDTLKIGVMYHRHRLAGVEGQITASISVGAHAKAAELGTHRVAAQECVIAMETATKAVAMPPGSCSSCGA